LFADSRYETDIRCKRYAMERRIRGSAIDRIPRCRQTRPL